MKQKRVDIVLATKDNTTVAPTPRTHPGNLGSQEELDNNAAINKINAELSKKKAARDSVARERAAAAELKRIRAGLKKYPNK